LAARIWSKWKDMQSALDLDAPLVRALDEQASALSSISWKLAVGSISNMEAERFKIDTPPRTIAVAVEFLAYELAVYDRLAFTRLEEDERQAFVLALANHIAEVIIDNLKDIFGPNDYEARVIEVLEARLEAYAEYNFIDNEPSYPFLGYFGKMVEEAMGQENQRWVKEQIIEIEGPKVTKAMVKAMNDLFSTGGR